MSRRAIRLPVITGMADYLRAERIVALLAEAEADPDDALLQRRARRVLELLERARDRMAEKGIKWQT